MTQAIQQYQTLADLKTSLGSAGEPPVPVISGKPAVLRTYLNPVQAVSNVTVQLSGVAGGSKPVTLDPNCTPELQRSGGNGCQSVDFYFTPPKGSWNATLNVMDGSGKVIETEALNFKSRDTSSLLLRGVSVCDARDASGAWLCADASDLLARTSLVTKVVPTGVVNVNITGETVQQDYTAYPDVSNWWPATVHQVGSLYGLFDAAADFLSNRRTTYFGMVRPAPTDGTPDPLGGTGGIADGIPSHGAMGRTSALRFKSNTETTVEVVGHETGHTLGLHHTNTDVPANLAAPPGCYNLAADSGTDWPFPDNRIQSTARLEVGFDVATHTIIDPNVNYELLSYCSPRWISPQRYKTMVSTLAGGAVTSPSLRGSSASNARIDGSARPADTPSASSAFWLVSGSISNSVAAFDPLFQLVTQGDTSTGTGTYSLQVRGTNSSVLFTRLFTPTTATTETSRKDITGPVSFSQVLPVEAGATAIVLLDPNGLELGRITLGGVAPGVTITSPAAGATESGTQPVAWSVQGASTFTSLVFYSSDGGTTWSQVARLANVTSTPVNFDKFPGSSQALVRIYVSDGVNTGSATSPAFNVPKKKPVVINIGSPTNNYAQPAVDPLYLSGSVYDVDDGVLTGSALQWTDNAAGALGSGSPLTVTLQPGKHLITLTGADSDGNSVSSSISVTLGGAPPVVTLAVKALNSVPTTCAYATVTAIPGVNSGAPLSSVQYSVDGGTTYVNIPLGSLPYGFLVPGSGFIHLVARAYDISGQSNATDTTFFTQSACTLKTQTITFAQLGDVVFGAPPITLQATSDSGLPVTFSVSGPATLAGSTLTITGIGTVTVTAMQTGNAIYAPAPLVSHSFNVLQATPVIVWAPPAPVPYGTTLAKILNASASVSGNPLPGTYSYTAQVSGSAPIPVTSSTVLAAGTYTLTVTFTPTDNTDYASATGSVSLVVGKGAATVSLASSANPSFPPATIKLTATVSTSVGQATGTVTFYDGSTAIGSATIAGGQAQLSLSSFTVGQHSLTAVYSGDQNFNPSTSAALTQVVADFTVTSDSANHFLQANSSTTVLLHVAPAAGTTIPVAVTFSVTGLPAGVAASFTPSSIAANSGATDVSLVLQAGASHAALAPYNRFGARGPVLSLAILILPFSFRRKILKQLRRRGLLSLFLVLSTVAAVFSLAGCGDNSQPKTYDVTVTATAGTLTHSVPFTLTLY